MPKALDKLVTKLKAQGKSTSSAFAIATSALQKQGVLKKGTRKLKRNGKK